MVFPPDPFDVAPQRLREILDDSFVQSDADQNINVCLTQVR